MPGEHFRDIVHRCLGCRDACLFQLLSAKPWNLHSLKMKNCIFECSLTDTCHLQQRSSAFSRQNICGNWNFSTPPQDIGFSTPTARMSGDVHSSYFTTPLCRVSPQYICRLRKVPLDFQLFGGPANCGRLRNLFVFHVGSHYINWAVVFR